MINGGISEHALITRVMAAQAAGATAVNGTGVDMAGFDGVLFVAEMGAIVAGAVTALKAQQSDDDGVGDTYGDLTGTSVTIGDAGDGGVFWLDIINPEKRFVRPVLVRGTQNATIDGIVAYRYQAEKLPVTQAATATSAGELHFRPAEGTA